MSSNLKLIVGLGNPGEQYARTRHNAGVWLVSRFADQQGATFKEEKKFFGRTATTLFESQEMRLLLPTTYMNESGKSVRALAHFFKIPPEQILIVHDELDLPTGVIRFKQGGGLAGHNGLRDITQRLGGNQDFNRLRIGVGHPGQKSDVTGHVLGKVSKKDESTIYQCIDEALRLMPLVVNGEWQKAMNELNGFKVEVS
ncbi:MAG: aminoacyl-tRNA hydrolase [Pseudomonadales bacterium]|nr:aminoacyl-tRNA hydrolase [Pseudomonadales bacterium]MDG1441731.1 aminoacyl-tRNA hydrolase [Pseudomonadales bacterium]